ncbi:HNH endonuclease [Leptospira jelokensis]|uniref:HNH endonuclease n=1 Tax=Leptospira jelokensis TaxID=2484931 RepID=UPI001090FCED|nr:HNH endonuclease [Leptospira jelokensis]TGM03239.1 EVE domain-containing protein [Leptospira jelokensis]
MNSWILQGSPDQFDINEYLTIADVIYWSVPYQKHVNQMKIGDQVFIWRSKGKSKNSYGVIAYGVIIFEPINRNLISEKIQLYDNLWKGDYEEKSETKIGIRILNLRLSVESGMITSDDFFNDEILKNSQIIKSRTGTVFHLSETEFNRIMEYWNELNPHNSKIENDEYHASEGNISIRRHLIRERNKTLRNHAISKFLNKNGSIYCEICGFNFEKTYGILGKGFIEVHHYEPLAKKKGNSKSKFSDLKLLCANCHRMVHQGNPIENYLKLENAFKANFYSE